MSADKPHQVPLAADLQQKIEWAEHLLRSLDEVVRSYASERPFGIRPVHNGLVEDGRRIWQVVGDLRFPPPKEVALLAGDVVQNTRSALDYLARVLVIASGGTPVDGPGGTQFPVREQAPRGTLRVQGCLDKQMIELIEGMQPYRSDDPKRHPLARLNLLNNINKHQTLPVVTGAGGVPAVVSLHSAGKRPRTGVVAPLLRWFFDGDRLDPVMHAFAPGVEPEAEGIIETVVSLSPDAWQTVGIVEELDFYLRYVRDHVIPSFRPFFSAPWPEEVFAHQQIEDPFSALPTVSPAELARISGQMLSMVGDGEDGARFVLLSLVPGLSAAMGYVTGDIELASSDDVAGRSGRAN